MILSCDDACASDIRLAELAKKYNVPCVFYWPVEWHRMAYDSGYEPLSYAEAINIAKEFEIGAHTISHRHLTKIPLEEALYEIKAPRWVLPAILDCPAPTKFAPPRGYTNIYLTKYTRSIYQSQRLTRGNDLVHVHPDSGANNNRHWLNCVNDNTKELWMHSWELDRYDLWDEVEKFLNDTHTKLPR